MLLYGVKDTEFKIYHGDTLTNDSRLLPEINPTKMPNWRRGGGQVESKLSQFNASQSSVSGNSRDSPLSIPNEPNNGEPIPGDEATRFAANGASSGKD